MILKSIAATIVVAASLAACGPTPTTPEAKPVKTSAPVAKAKYADTPAWCAKARAVVGTMVDNLPSDPFEKAGYLLGVGEGLSKAGAGEDLTPAVKAALAKLHKAYVAGISAANSGDLDGVTEALQDNAAGTTALNAACSAVNA